MGDRFRHLQHVFRVGVVLGVGLVAFLIARAAAIPSDFGVLGFYRAGALDDNRALPIVHAGRTACLECHDGTYDPPEPESEASAKALATAVPLDPVKDNKHFRLNCEACHGPLQKHVADEDKALPVPKVAAESLCLNCHSKVSGRPRFQPRQSSGSASRSRAIGPRTQSRFAPVRRSSAGTASADRPDR